MNRLDVILLCFLGLVNVLALCEYGIDKMCAPKGKRRIPEAMLLWIAVLGGSFGAWLGMRMFRHKTKHWKFRLLVPLLLLLHCILVAVYITFRMGYPLPYFLNA